MGAWIETSIEARLTGVSAVAPLVGAWIETNAVRAGAGAAGVAPLVGAWIETFESLSNNFATLVSRLNETTSI